MTLAPCHICGNARLESIQDGVRDQEYGAPGTYSWIRCAGCHLVKLDPMPDNRVLALAYPEHYHAYATPQSAISRRLILGATKKNAQGLARRLPPGGSVLDVGCSTGDLLTEIGALGDFKLFGVEYKPSAAETARQRGIHVWQGDFEDAAIPPASMDLIVMQHVLEHVRDPAKVLAIVARVLKPGGVIVGELPNLRSWDAALFGRYWGGGHAPRHLWHFTPDTLRALLERTGLREATTSPALHTGHWALSIQNFLRRNATDTAGLTSGRSWYYPLFLLATVPINAIQLLLNRTGVMRFSARKPA